MTIKIHTIEFEIDWDAFRLYASFFIPALNWRQAKEIVTKEAEKRGFQVVVRISVENDIQGIRVWRVQKRG
jgi:hypothetical protein